MPSMTPRSQHASGRAIRLRAAGEPDLHRRRPAFDRGLRPADRARGAAHSGLTILGPAEAPLAIVRGRHRFRLLIKSARGFDLSGYLREWLAAAPKPKKKLGLEVDIDPQSFL